MKFKKGNIVKEIKGFNKTGVIIKAEKDESWASGEKYLIDFGPREGNQMSDGSDFKLEKKK